MQSYKRIDPSTKLFIGFKFSDAVNTFRIVGEKGYDWIYINEKDPTKKFFYIKTYFAEALSAYGYFTKNKITLEKL